ncbi:MAG: M14 family zinc carboxypeptidase [Sumerlaeia bacterium]
MVLTVRAALVAVFVLAFANLQADPTIVTSPGLQMRVGTWSVLPAGTDEWDVDLSVAFDNDNSSSFRAWWHVEVADLNPAVAETFNFDITGSQFPGDYITPVWSLDGGATYERIPGLQGPFNFTVTVPAGISSFRIAKYYPYTLPEYEAFKASVETHPYVTVTTSTQTTTLGNKLYLFEITDPGVSNAGKKRVWIHSAVHPSENTAHFTTEGLIDFLLSGSTEAELILDELIFDIVPVANPDGIERGNYRTNADSINLEVQWASPYNPGIPENEFMIEKIEEFMGTSGSPGANPIELLLNLHATHGNEPPYHFVHNANYNINGTGVIPEVRALEDAWVTAIRNRNAYVDDGSDHFSSLSGRVYVESMMHDRYSLDSTWNDIMAITLEGVYQIGPDPGIPNTPDDYRQMGEDMGLAIADYFGVDLTASGINAWMLLEANALDAAAPAGDVWPPMVTLANRCAPFEHGRRGFVLVRR